MKENLTNKQIAFMIFGAIAGYNVIILPKNITEAVGTGGWITLSLLTLFSIFFTYIIVYLQYTHKDQTLFEYSEELTGKFISRIFICIYIITFFFTFTMLTRISSEVIKLSVLKKTPQSALCLTFFAIIFYVVIKRLRVLARLCEFYGIIIIIVATGMHIFMFTQGDFINIRPLFISKNMPKYFTSSFRFITAFLGMEILTFIPFNKNNNKKVFKFSLLMICLIGVLYITLVEACISLMGINDVIHYKDATFVAVRRLDIEYLQIFRRLDGFFLSAWIMSLICTISAYAYGTVIFLNKLLKRISFNLIALFVFAVSFFISQLPSKISKIEELLKYNGYLGILTAVIIPLLLFIITKVKNHAQ